MHISEIGIELLKSCEGLRLFPYDDHDGTRLTEDAEGYHRPDGSPPKGTPTIGIGHAIRPTERFSEITRDGAEALLRLDLRDAESAVNRQIPDSTEGWNQHRFDAITSFTYNCGGGALVKSGIPQACADGRFDDCKVILMAYVHVKGVVSAGLKMRRAKEWALFATPMPTVPIDVSAVMGLVYETASQVIGELEAETLPPPPPVDRDTLPES